MTHNTHYTMDEPDRIMFQELVMYPTLAPQLACTKNHHLPLVANAAAPLGAGHVVTAAADLVEMWECFGFFLIGLNVE